MMRPGEARCAAMKALEIEDTLAEAHASLACVRLYYDWNWDSAFALARWALGLSYERQGRHAESIEAFRQAIRLGRLRADPRFSDLARRVGLAA